MKLADAFVEAHLDTSRIRQSAQRQIDAALAGVDAHIGLEADPRRLRQSMASAVQAASAGLDAEVEVGADDSGLRGEVSRAVAAASVGQEVRVGVDVDTRAASSSMNGLLGSVSRLRAGVFSLSQVVNVLQFSAIVASAAPAAQALGALAAAATGVVGALGPLVGISATVPSGILQLVQSFASLKLATGGIGDAVKALGQAEVKAGRDSEAAARTAKAAAEAREAAAERVRDATLRVGEAQERGAERTSDAADRVSEAERDAAAVTERSRRRIEEATERGTQTVARAADRVRDARRSEASAVEQGAQRMKSAEESLGRAQRAAVQAQQALNRARQDAARRLREMQNAVEDAMLAEVDSIMAVDEARQALLEVESDPESTELERRRARFTVEQAERRARAAREARDEESAAFREATRVGVEGSEQVIAAKERESEAAAAVGEAMEAAAEVAREAAASQTLAAEKVGEAIAAQTEAEREALRDVADAQRDAAEQQTQAAERVSAAREAEARTHREVSRSIEAALRDLSDALDDQADKAETTSERTSASVSKVQEAFADLPPAAREFALFLDSLRPKLEQLRNTAASNLFPGVTEGLKSMEGLFPVIDEMVGDTAKVFGDLAAEAGKLFGSEAFGRDLDTIFDQNEEALRDLGNAGLLVADGLRHVGVAVGPLVDHMTTLAQQGAMHFRDWAAAGRETGSLEAFFDRTADAIDRVISISGNLYTIIRNIGSAAAPLGNDLLASFDEITNRIATTTQSLSGQNALRDYFDSMRPTLHELALLIGDIGRAFILLSQDGSAPAFIAMLRTDLLPAIVNLAQSGRELGPIFIEALSGIVNLLASLSSGPLASVIEAIGAVADLLAKIVNLHPALGELAGAFALFRVADKFGLDKLALAVGGLGPAASTAAGEVAGASGRMGAAFDAAGLRAAAMKVGVLGAILAILEGFNDLKEAERKGAAAADAALGNALSTQNINEVKAANDALAAGVEQASQKVGAYTEGWRQWQGGIKGAVELLTPLPNTVADNVAQLNLMTGAAEQVAARLAAMTGAVESVGSATGLTATEVGALASKMNVDLGTAGTNTIAAIILEFDRLAKQAGFTGTEMANASGLSLTELTKLAAETERFRNTFDTAFSNATNIMSEFGGKTTVTGAEVVAFYTNTREQVQRWADNLRELHGKVPDELVRSFAEAGPKTAPVVAGVLDAVRSGNADVINKAVEDTKGLQAKIREELAAQKEGARKDGEELGISIVAGIAAGLGNAKATGDLNETAKVVIRGTMETMRGEAQAKSPARLFADRVGLPIAQGVALGMRQGQRELATASRDMMSALAGMGAPSMGGGGYGGFGRGGGGAVEISPASANVIARAVASVIPPAGVTIGAINAPSGTAQDVIAEAHWRRKTAGMP